MIHYYGTSLTNAGHYWWNLECDKMQTDRSISIYHPPFDAYKVIQREKGRKEKKGDVGFVQIEGYSILAIEGSCKDDRWGTVSVFFVKEELSKEKLIERIKATPIAMKIINAMPFDVQL